jgi:hypothetical protein
MDGAISLRVGRAPHNRRGGVVSIAPQFVVIAPQCRLAARRRRGEPARTAKEYAMPANRPEPNAELARNFEPLRILFALSSLGLGLLAMLRF